MVGTLPSISFHLSNNGLDSNAGLNIFGVCCHQLAWHAACHLSPEAGVAYMYSAVGYTCKRTLSLHVMIGSYA